MIASVLKKWQICFLSALFFGSINYLADFKRWDSDDADGWPLPLLCKRGFLLTKSVNIRVGTSALSVF